MASSFEWSRLFKTSWFSLPLHAASVFLMTVSAEVFLILSPVCLRRFLRTSRIWVALPPWNSVACFHRSSLEETSTSNANQHLTFAVTLCDELIRVLEYVLFLYRIEELLTISRAERLRWTKYPGQKPRVSTTTPAPLVTSATIPSMRVQLVGLKTLTLTSISQCCSRASSRQMSLW